MKTFIHLTVLLFVVAAFSMPAIAAEGSHKLIDGDAQFVNVEDAHGVDGHGKAQKGLPQLDPEYYPSQIFWLTVTFLCMYLVFSKKVLPEMSATIEGRHTSIRENLDDAESLKQKAEDVHKAYDEILGDARTQSSDMFVKVEADIKKKTNKKLESFQTRANTQVRDMEDAVAEAQKDAMADMHVIAAQTASIAAEKITGISTDIKNAQSVVKNIDKKAA